MRAAKVDTAQPAIVTALRKAGAFVRHIREGDGFPDLCICFRGRVHLVEVKSDEAAARRKSLTADRQREFRDNAAYCGVIVPVVTSVDEALRAIGATHGL